MVLVIFFVFFSIAWIGLAQVRETQENTIKETISKKGEYTAFIAKYKQDEQEYQERVNRLQVRPAKKTEIDGIQQGLLKKMQLYQLDLQSMNVIAKPATQQSGNPKQPVAPPDGVEYESTVLGSWENTMRYLNELTTEPVLINLMSVKIELGTNSQLKTTFKYKIYCQ